MYIKVIKRKVEGYTQQHSELKARLRYMETCLKKQNQTKTQYLPDGSAD